MRGLFRWSHQGSDIVEVEVYKAAGAFGAAILGGVGLAEVPLMAFGDDLFALFMDDVFRHFVEQGPEGIEIFLVEVDLVFLVMEGAVVVGKLLAFSYREVVISGSGAANIKKIGPSAGSQNFGIDLFLVL